MTGRRKDRTFLPAMMAMNNHGPWILLFCRTVASHGPEYVDQLGFDRTALSYSRGSRRLQSSEWEPMRIYVHAAHLEQDLQDQQALTYFRDDVLQAVVRWLSVALRVRPVLGALQFEKHCSLVDPSSNDCVEVSGNFQTCGESTIPNAHFRDREYCSMGLVKDCEVSKGGAGVSNADFALYVTARDTRSCSGGTVAYAGTCRQDSADRPIAGHINLCKTRMLQGKDWYRDVATTLHETLHALGFASNMFPFFRDDLGAPRTPRLQSGLPPYDAQGYLAASGTILQDTSLKRHYVTLPRVIDAARKHFGCEVLDRVPLEEAGGDGSAFSHWDARAMHTETMTSSAGRHPLVSRMTLALFEDSGWYKPDYAHADTLFFGHNEGCGFLSEPCVKDGVSAFPDQFCSAGGSHLCGRTSSSQVGCSSGRMAKAVCTSCIHAQPLPPIFQHFVDPRMGGTQESLGFCPVWEPYTVLDSRGRGKQSFCQEGKPDQHRGESYGSSSRCIMSTVVSYRYEPPRTLQGSCRHVQCQQDSLLVKVTPNHWVTCTASDEGRRKAAPDRWNGGILCPSFKEICGSSGNVGPEAGSAPCTFPGGRMNGRCNCPAGAMHEDCSVLDIKSNRAIYPFGLRYAQEELVLEHGTPLSMSADIWSWPFRPRLSSGPAQLHFFVLPSLPAGLTLTTADGAITGTPKGSSVRAPYTVHACGRWGGATTVIFLTVKCGAESQHCAPSDTSSTGSTPTCKSKQIDASSFGEMTNTSSAKRFLRMVFRDVLFRSIQLEPGLVAFIDSFSETASASLGYDMETSSASALSGGVVGIEFAPSLNSSDYEHFLQVGELLVQQLDDSRSALRESNFGKLYLGNVWLYQVTEEGIEKLWPLPEEENMFEAALRNWRSWLPYAAGSSLVLSLCLQVLVWLGSKKEEEPRRSRPSNRCQCSLMAWASRVAVATALFGVVGLAVIIVDRVFMLEEPGEENADASFSLSAFQLTDLQKGCLLCVLSLLVLQMFISFIECCCKWRKSRRGDADDEQAPCESWLASLSTAISITATLVFLAWGGSIIAPHLPLAENFTKSIHLESWQTTAAVIALTVVCLLVSLAFSRICSCCKPKRRAPLLARPDNANQRTVGGAARSAGVGTRASERAGLTSVAPSVVGTPVSYEQPPSDRQKNDAMSKMLEMGFVWDPSLKALERHSWNVEQAADALFAQNAFA